MQRQSDSLRLLLKFEAAAHNYRDPLNPARWRGHLDKLLPRPGKVKNVTHHPAMPYKELPAFMLELGEHEGIGAAALQFTILTACRTGEVINAKWNEVDMGTAIWTIPANRVKAKREHRVPLPDSAFRVLEHLEETRTSNFRPPLLYTVLSCRIQYF